MTLKIISSTANAEMVIFDILKKHNSREESFDLSLESLNDKSTIVKVAASTRVSFLENLIAMQGGVLIQWHPADTVSFLDNGDISNYKLWKIIATFSLPTNPK